LLETLETNFNSFFDGFLTKNSLIELFFIMGGQNNLFSKIFSLPVASWLFFNNDPFHPPLN
jgi:hypothetical protein